jgi:cytochrome c oxidase assembly factor CtaG/cytochrome c2
MTAMSPGLSMQDLAFAGIAVSAFLYAVGWFRTHKSSSSRRAAWLEPAAFAAALAILFAVLATGETAAHYTAHMVRHLLVVLAAAPLLVLARPTVPLLYVFQGPTRHFLVRCRRKAALLFADASTPIYVWLLFNGIFLFWHLPAAYRMSEASMFVHAAEFASLLCASCLFWSVVFARGKRRKLGYGATALFVTSTAFITDMPGVLMIFSPVTLFSDDLSVAGFTALEDQQLAGAVMWVPANLVFFAAALWAAVEWMKPASAVQRLSSPLHILLVFAFLAAGLSGCGAPVPQTAFTRHIGDASRGRGLISYYGCSSCHTIPGVPGAHALVGPPLNHFSKRIYIAGMLRNSPDNLVLWVRNPQAIVPGNAMPRMGIDQRDARDIAAFLYTIR